MGLSKNSKIFDGCEKNERILKKICSPDFYESPCEKVACYQNYTCQYVVQKTPLKQLVIPSVLRYSLTEDASITIHPTVIHEI
ncbi:MAG: hypothetical protein ACI8RD_010538 [Bacillariaceae sp.]|jgi:hypothetical protein